MGLEPGLIAVRLLGIDPGSRITGFGVIDLVGGCPRYVASGCVRTSDEALEQRLAQIYAGLSDVVGRYVPSHAVVERVFLSRNVDSALKLGQARGAALVCMANHGLGVSEYAARHIKQAITGQGGADKAQVQHMVTAILGLNESPQEDAADALAAAITEGYARARKLPPGGELPRRSSARLRKGGGRWRL